MKKFNTTILLISLFLVLIISNCKKNNLLITPKDFTLKGKILDAITGAPAVGVKVDFAANQDCAGRPDQYASVFSGQDGSYQFTMDRSYNCQISLSISHPNFLQQRFGIILNGNDRTYIRDIHAQPLAFIKIHIKDTGLTTDNYSIGFNTYYGFWEYAGGANFDSVYCCNYSLAFLPDTLIYKTLDYKNSVYNTYKIPLNLPEFQTKEFELFY